MNLAPDASVLEMELQRTIEDCNSATAETQRMALVLRRYEQLSYGRLQSSRAVRARVKSVLFRARTELRTRLSKYLVKGSQVLFSAEGAMSASA